VRGAQVTEVEICQAVAVWAHGVAADGGRSRAQSVAASTDSDEGAPDRGPALSSLPELVEVKAQIDLAFVSNDDIFNVRTRLRICVVCLLCSELGRQHNATAMQCECHFVCAVPCCALSAPFHALFVSRGHVPAAALTCAQKQATACRRCMDVCELTVHLCLSSQTSACAEDQAPGALLEAGAH
jgi:hypothetical protein